MSSDGPQARLVFGGVEVQPAGAVVKAVERERWRALDAFRSEADALIENEALAAMERAAAQAQTQVRAEFAQRLAEALAAFDGAAARIEAKVLELAVQIAARVIGEQPQEQLHAAALARLHTLVPAGAALRIRIHPQAAGAAAALAELAAGGALKSRQVSVVVDPAATDPTLLQVEHAGGVLDLGAEAHLRRIVRTINGLIGHGGGA